MKYWILGGAAALQILALGFMAGEREYILRKGRVVHLRTSPLDPRDVMRGDYVRLNYEISQVRRPLWKDGLAKPRDPETPLPRDMKVYAALDVDSQGNASITSLSDKPPASGVFIRGRLENSWSEQMTVRYGIEAFFMQQGKAIILERSNDRNGIQVPLEMAVAVGPSGTAVLKDYRCSDLGMGLTLDGREEVINGSRRQRLIAATIRIANFGSNDVAILNAPGGHSLDLVSDLQWNDNQYEWVNKGREKPCPLPEDVRILRPGEILTNRVDFNDAYWSVAQANSPTNQTPVPKKLADLQDNWSSRFRFQYAPPSPDILTNLPHAEKMWRGRLTSRAFTPGGSVD